MKFDVSELEFKSLAEEKPVIIQLMAKVKTVCSPLDLYASFNKKCAYLLESVEKEKKHARFSFVGAEPDAIVTIKDRSLKLDYTKRTRLTDFMASSLSKVCDLNRSTPGMKDRISGRIKSGLDAMDALRSAFAASEVKFIGSGFDRQTFLGGAIGFCAYDMVYDCWLEISTKKSQTPDAQFALTTRTVVFDHLTDETYIVMTPFVLKDDVPEDVYKSALDDAENLASAIRSAKPLVACRNNPSGIRCNMEKKEYEDAVRKAKKHIIDGDIFQVVLSRRHEVTTDQTPL
ncbi:MAG TPA: anthranilate synthase component I, partial [Candidatus Methanoperedens sp.]